MRHKGSSRRRFGGWEGIALVTLIGLVLADSPGGDLNATSRVIQGILAGIGFIGGGVILHGRRDQSVHGLTTAASIWIVSATDPAHADSSRSDLHGSLDLIRPPEADTSIRRRPDITIRV